MTDIEKAKSLWFNFCTEKSCNGINDCRSCPKAQVHPQLIEMAEWKDKNPSVETIQKIVVYALRQTNIMLSEDLENGVEWELLIKKALQ